MKIKEQAKELQELLNAANIKVSNEDISGSEVVDDIPDELEPEPIFDINYDKCKRDFIKKARNSIKKIVRVVITDPNMIDYSFISDKIDQDADQLGFLYYQQRLHELIQQANMESIRTGNVSPRMIEVFTTVGKNLMDITKQIADFQISIKDNYAKIKFDAIEDVDFTKALPSSSNTEEENEMEKNNIFIGGKNLNKSIQEQKKALIAKAQEAKFEEVINNPA